MQSIRWGIPWILYGAINRTPDSGLPTLHALSYAYVLGTFLRFPGGLHTLFAYSVQGEVVN